MAIKKMVMIFVSMMTAVDTNLPIDNNYVAIGVRMSSN